MVVHTYNGGNGITKYATSSQNGAVRVMSSEVYIEPNGDDKARVHQVEISYVGSGIHRLDNFAFTQPACEIGEIIDTVEPDKPPKPIGPVTSYAPDTAYQVGDTVTVTDASGVMRTYVCNTAYVSGFQGTWTRFKVEIGNWTRIANIIIIKIKIA